MAQDIYWRLEVGNFKYLPRQGRDLGVNWYGSRLFDLKNALKTGENQLTIRSTTTLWNAIGKEPPQPSGVIGPVRLR